MENRPRGRQKHVTGTGKDIYKRGDGLNTGAPVGRQDGYAGRKTGASAANVTRKGGIGLGTIVILVLAFFLLKSCMSSGASVQTAGTAAQNSYGGSGSIFDALLGGGSDDGSSLGTVGSSSGTGSSSGSSSVSQQLPAQTQTPSSSVTQSSGGSSLSSLLGGFSGGSTVSSGWDRAANVGKLDTSVVSGARAKRTQIVGSGGDQITVMVYMCGTDLESKNGMGTSDLQEMANASFGDNVNILVYTGGCKRWKASFISNSVNQIYKVESGGLRCLVNDDGKDSMVKPATLTRFIKFCKQNYPANRYELIFWDHGGGSLSGYGYDEKNVSAGSMSLAGINEALKAANTTFDFIGFDACLMATLENGLMLEPYADYMIASEETEPGVGWYYTNWLTNLSKNPSMPTVEIGRNIVDDFVSVCNQRCQGQKTTLSVVDLAELKKTAPKALSAFASSTSALLQGNDYKTVSDARAGSREFAASNKIDQVDLVHLAGKLGTPEGEALAQALLGAVKYNKTSSSMTNAYGLSIYFPYKRASKVNSAVATYQAIGMDSEYSRCIQQFASLGCAGQAASGGASSPLGSLFGDGYDDGSSLDLGSLFGGLFGGRSLGNVDGLTEDNAGFLQQGVDVDTAVQTVSENRFDPTALVWTTVDGQTVMRLSEAQWSQVHDLQLNVFYDDGDGFIDLGLDNVFDFTDDGALIGDYDGTWLAIDDQPIAYYYVDSDYDGDSYVINGRAPVLLNGERAELLIRFDNDHPDGYIVGARSVYADGETDTVGKSLITGAGDSAGTAAAAAEGVEPLGGYEGVTGLQPGDELQFLCDYYSYEGEYQNSYLLGDVMEYREGMVISNVYINRERVRGTYLFTDIYDQEYWTPPMP